MQPRSLLNSVLGRFGPIGIAIAIATVSSIVVPTIDTHPASAAPSDIDIIVVGRGGDANPLPAGDSQVIELPVASSPAGALILDVDIGLSVSATVTTGWGAFVRYDPPDLPPTTELDSVRLVGRHNGTVGTDTTCDDDALTLDNEAPRGLNAAGQVGRFRPDGDLSELRGLRAGGEWTVRFDNLSSRFPLTVRCVRVTTTYLSPTDGIYRVTTTSDRIDFSDGDLSVREALLAAELDGRSSRIELPPRQRVDLDCAARGLRVNATQPVHIVGDDTTLAGCEGAATVVATGTEAVLIEGVSFTRGRGALVNSADTTIRNARIHTDGYAAVNANRLTLEHVGVFGTNESSAIDHRGSRLTIRDSVFQDNANRAVDALSGQTVIERTTFRNNAGAVFVSGGRADISTSLFVNNRVPGFGGASSVESFDERPIRLHHVTMLHNASPAVSGANIALDASVVAFSLGNTNCAPTGTWPESRLSAATDASCQLREADLGQVDLRVVTSGEGQGQLLAGSPLIDVVPSCPALDIHQRPRPQGLRCDVGAFEAVAQAPTPPTPTPTPQPSPTPQPDDEQPSPTPTPQPDDEKPVPDPTPKPDSPADTDHPTPGPDTTDDGSSPDPTDPPLTCGGRQATIVGTAGDDVIVGTPGPDVIVGLGGRDTIRGLAGDDVICGDGGRDRISGGPGDDVVIGGGGRDRLSGNGDDDHLRGGRGRDTLRGGKGTDDCRGGRGRDRLTGCP